MSLINQMLKDLEARKQQGVTHSSQQVEVAVCQPVKGYRWRIVVWALVAVLVLSGGASWWWLNQPRIAVHRESVLLQAQPAQVANTDENLEQHLSIVAEMEVVADPVGEQIIASHPDATLKQQTVEPIIVAEPAITVEVMTEVPTPPAPLAVKTSFVKKDEEVVSDESSHAELEKSAPPVVATVVVKAPSLSEQADQLRTKGRDLVHQKRYQSAAHMFNQAMSIDGGSAHQWQEFVRACVLANDLPQAISASARGCEKFPNDVGLRVYHARLIVESGDYSAALLVLQTGGVPGVESSSDYYALLASVLQQLRRFDEAGQQYALLTSSYPQRGDWWIGRAICDDQLGNSLQASTYYQQAMKCQQLNPQLKKFAVEQLARLRKG